MAETARAMLTVSAFAWAASNSKRICWKASIIGAQVVEHGGQLAVQRPANARRRVGGQSLFRPEQVLELLPVVGRIAKHFVRCHERCRIGRCGLVLRLYGRERPYREHEQADKEGFAHILVPPALLQRNSVGNEMYAMYTLCIRVFHGFTRGLP